MRVIKHGSHHPYALKMRDLPGFSNLTSDEKLLNYEVHLCACGLSRNKPYCDGSHAKTKTEDEAKLYAYDIEGNGSEVNETEELAEAPDEYVD